MERRHSDRRIVLLANYNESVSQLFAVVTVKDSLPNTSRQIDLLSQGELADEGLSFRVGISPGTRSATPWRWIERQ